MARARPPLFRTIKPPRDHTGPEIGYRFSNGREFNDYGLNRSVYAGVHPGDAILQEDGFGKIMQEDGLGAVLQE